MTRIVIGNRIKESGTVSGQGNVTLNGAVTGFNTFASKIQTGSLVPYIIIQGTSVHEQGLGTLISTSELSRDTIIDSSSTSGYVNNQTPGSPVKVDFSSGQSVTVYCGLISNLPLLVDDEGKLVDPSPFRLTVFYESIADMKADDGLTDKEMVLIGANGSLGGLFKWDASDATLPDNVDTFRSDNYATGLWKRVRPDIAGAITGTLNIDATSSDGAEQKLFFNKIATNPNDWSSIYADLTNKALRLRSRFNQASVKNFLSLFTPGTASDRVEVHVPVVLPSVVDSTGLKARTLSLLSGVSELALIQADAANDSTAAVYRVIPRVSSYSVADLMDVYKLRQLDPVALGYADGSVAIVRGRNETSGNSTVNNSGNIEPFIWYWASTSSLNESATVVRPSVGSAAIGNGRWLLLTSNISQNFTSGVATPSVKWGEWFVTAGSTAITNFIDGYEGQMITIQRGSADITITHDPTKIDLGGTNQTLTAVSPRLTFVNVGGVWYSFGGSNQVDNSITAGVTTRAPSQDAVKNFVETLLSGFSPKQAVRCATTTNITLSGEQTIDGVSVVAGDRVLVKNQSTASENGIRLVAVGSWTRAPDFDAWSEVPSAYVMVQEGSTLADTGWVCTSNAGGTIGSTAITWVQFSGAGTYVDNSITAGVTTRAPSQDAVNTALNLKANKANPSITGNMDQLGSVNDGFVYHIIRNAGSGATKAMLSLDPSSNTVGVRDVQIIADGAGSTSVGLEIKVPNGDVPARAVYINPNRRVDFSVRPQFNGNTPWDSGNYTPRPSVASYGANNVGTADASAAFSTAAQSIAADYTNPYDKLAFGIPIPDGVRVRVPAGRYRLDNPVNPSGRAVTWELDSGVIFVDSSNVQNFNVQNNLGGRVISHNGRVNFTGTSGIRDQACGAAVLVGDSNNFGGAGIAGFAGMTDFVYYTGRELGGQYVELRQHKLVADKSDTTFTTTGTGKRVTFASALSAEKVRRIIIGMIIDSDDGASGLASYERWSGIITSFDPSGSWIEVSEWYKTNHGSLATGTPTNGTRIYVNPCTKTFAQNVNVIMNAPNHEGAGSPVFLTYNTLAHFPTTGASGVVYYNVANATHYVWNGSAYVTASAAQIPYYTKQAAAVEFAVISDFGSMPDADTEVKYAWGVDVGYNDRSFANSGALGANPGGGKGSRAFSARAGGLGGWHCGFYADGGNNMGWAFNGQNSSIGYRYKGATGNYIFLGVDGSGNQTTALLNNGSGVFGNTSTGGTITWDFKTSASSPNDVRLLFSGGNSTSERGQLTIGCDIINMNVNTRIAPSTDNKTDLGSTSNRFKDGHFYGSVYAGASGVALTSDRRIKEEIEPLNTDKLIEILLSVPAVSFKLKNEAHEEVIETNTRLVQKTRKVTTVTQKEVFEVVDGKAVRKIIDEETVSDEPVFESFPKFDEDGKPIYNQEILKNTGQLVQDVYLVPVMEEVTETRVVSSAVEATHRRKHWGFIAQDFEAAVLAAGYTSEQCAAYIIDENGKYGLRTNELMSVLWGAVQQLIERVRDLESRN